MKFIEKWWFWFVASVVLYANTINHDYAIDDRIVVTSNKLTQEGIGGIPDIFSHSYLFGYDGREDESYRPIPLATFAIEKSFFNADSKVSHFFQVVLYGLTILVLFNWLRAFFEEDRKVYVYAICLLYMLHPIHTEVVANVKSRDELLSALFLFFSLWLFTDWVVRSDKRKLMLSIFVFFMAMLSKETAVLGVILFPAVCYFKGFDLKQTFLRSYFYLIPFTTYFIIRSMVLSDVLIQDPIDPVANSLALAQNYSELLSTNLAIFAKYLQLSIFPLKMSWDYSVSTFPIVGFADVSAFIGLISALLLIGILIYGVIKRNSVGFGALLFAATFALSSNFFFLINCNLGERFLFMPVLGVIMVLVFGVEKITANIPKKITLSFFVILLFGFTGRTFIRNLDWKNNLTIYESALNVAPHSVKVHFNLGTEYLEQGNSTSERKAKLTWYNKAAHELEVAGEIYPKYVNTYENQAYVYAELGKLGSTKVDSLQQFIKGIRVLSYAIDSLGLRKKSLFQNNFYLLDQLVKVSTNESDKELYMKEIVRNVNLINQPTYEDVQRAMYYLRLLGDVDLLSKKAERFVQLFPGQKAYLLQLSELYFKENKFDESLKILAIYVKSEPNDLNAKSNLGMLWEIVGNKKEALLIYEEILAVDPNQAHTKELHSKLTGK